MQKVFRSLYAQETLSTNACGNEEINLNKLVDVINYMASKQISVLYLVKLVKMLWYSDFLNYKRYGKSITGMVYKALPMGAAPIGYEQITSLHGIHFQEKNFGDGVGYLFLADKDYQITWLSRQEIGSIDTVIEKFRDISKDDIIRIMHGEDAYMKTELYHVISYDYAATLSLE